MAAMSAYKYSAKHSKQPRAAFPRFQRLAVRGESVTGMRLGSDTGRFH
jgi:hypothetical protein